MQPNPRQVAQRERERLLARGHRCGLCDGWILPKDRWEDLELWTRAVQRGRGLPVDLQLEGVVHARCYADNPGWTPQLAAAARLQQAALPPPEPERATPASPEALEVWAEALQRLRVTTKRSVFESWIERLRPVRIRHTVDGPVLLLEAPDDGFRDYVSANLDGKLAGALEPDGMVWQWREEAELEEAYARSSSANVHSASSANVDSGAQRGAGRMADAEATV